MLKLNAKISNLRYKQFIRLRLAKQKYQHNKLVLFFLLLLLFESIIAFQVEEALFFHLDEDVVYLQIKTDSNFLFNQLICSSSNI